MHATANITIGNTYYVVSYYICELMSCIDRNQND